MTIEELISRLEKAEGANFALDNAIGELFEPERVEHGLNHRCYTGSLDDALALAVKLLDNGSVDIEVAYRTVGGKAYGRAEICGPHFSVHAKGKTPAIALCIAILRALQEQRP